MSNTSSDYLARLKTSQVRDRRNTLDLRVGMTTPASGEADRWLVLSNGRTEWLEKYLHVPADLKIAQSTGFMTWDHRGQGASGGARAWIDDYHSYSSDMAEVIKATVMNKPYNLVCHSMGGLIALHAIMHDYIKPRCLVISSPLIGLPRLPMPPALAHKISGVFASLGFGHLRSGAGRHTKTPFAGNLLTHSAERFGLVQSSPYPVPSPTFQWVKASFEATVAIHDPKLLKKLTMPILLLSGTAERVVDVGAIQPWLQLAREHAPTKVDMQWIQDARHELLFESKTYYDRTIAVISEWFIKIGCPV